MPQKSVCIELSCNKRGENDFTQLPKKDKKQDESRSSKGRKWTGTPRGKGAKSAKSTKPVYQMNRYGGNGEQKEETPVCAASLSLLIRGDSKKEKVVSGSESNEGVVSGSTCNSKLSNPINQDNITGEHIKNRETGNPSSSSSHVEGTSSYQQQTTTKSTPRCVWGKNPKTKGAIHIPHPTETQPSTHTQPKNSGGGNASGSGNSNNINIKKQGAPKIGYDKVFSKITPKDISGDTVDLIIEDITDVDLPQEFLQLNMDENKAGGNRNKGEKQGKGGDIGDKSNRSAVEKGSKVGRESYHPVYSKSSNKLDAKNPSSFVQASTGRAREKIKEVSAHSTITTNSNKSMGSIVGQTLTGKSVGGSKVNETQYRSLKGGKEEEITSKIRSSTMLVGLSNPIKSKKENNKSLTPPPLTGTTGSMGVDTSSTHQNIKSTSTQMEAALLLSPGRGKRPKGQQTETPNLKGSRNDAWNKRKGGTLDGKTPTDLPHSDQAKRNLTLHEPTVIHNKE